MNALLIISLILVALFAGATIWRTRNLPESLSAIVFDLPRPLQWSWSVWLWAVTFLVSIPTIEVLSEKGAESVGFAMMISLAFTGALPLIDKDGRKAHYIFAIIGSVASQACTFIISPWWLMMWLLIVVNPLMDRMWWHQSVPVWMWRNGLLFSEAVCYGTLILAHLTR